MNRLAGPSSGCGCENISFELQDRVEARISGLEKVTCGCSEKGFVSLGFGQHALLLVELMF